MKYQLLYAFKNFLDHDICKSTAFETTSFEIAENEISLDVTSMSNDINRFGGVSAVDPFIDTGLAVPMATVGKERKFTATIADDTGRAQFFVKRKRNYGSIQSQCSYTMLG